jgi:predicted transcriptional regulator of viral defense system
MPGRNYIALLEHAQGHYGFVTTDDSRALGIDPAQLRIMASRGQLEHRGRGIYRMPVIPHGELDEYMETVLWTGREGVISHESALLIHDLSDVNPSRVHVTVPVGFRTRKKPLPVLEVHREEIPPGGTIVHRGIPTVTAAMAIRQCIAGGLGWTIIRQAMDEARSRGLIDVQTVRELRRLKPAEAAA